MSEHAPSPLNETIATYDAIARGYAVRFAVTDRPRARQGFHGVSVGLEGLILDVGCGPGLDCRRFRRSGLDPIGLDLSRGMLTEARTITDVPLVQADLRHLPFAPACAAGVWCDAALVHLELDGVSTALHEFAAVLVEGGALFVSLCDGRGAEWWPGPSGRRRWFHHYDEPTVTSLVENAGFAIVSTERLAHDDGSWFSVLARRLPLDGSGLRTPAV